jgi:hypothetical protein
MQKSVLISLNVEKLAGKVRLKKLEVEQFLSLFMMDIRFALRRVVTAMVKPYMWNMGSSSSPFFPIFQIRSLKISAESCGRHSLLNQRSSGRNEQNLK